MNLSPESITEPMPPSAYFGSLTLENVKCFKGEQTIDLSDGNGKPALWTVILGNNNTGKTTLLRCLAYLEPIKEVFDNKCYYSPKISNLHINNKLSENNYYIECKWIFDKMIINSVKDWSCFKKDRFSAISTAEQNEIIGNAIIYGYGTSRKMGDSALSETENQDNTASLFSDNVTLTNAEEWLLQTFLAEKLNKPQAAETLERIKQVLTSGILPDVQDFRFDTTADFRGFVEIKTDYGWVKLRELGYGYQVTLAWVVDLAKKLFERYPDSDNPLHEPAIVLIDEIDLHLHPEWQRKIIKFLSDQFPRTQFIATTHSPLIVQSAENINLVILEKQDDHVIIKQRPDIKSFKGWTVEEILTELMGMDDKTLSDDYLKFMHQFDEALDKDDYHKAKQAYDELDKILHPKSVQRKLLSIQMSSLVAE
jgi:predicted ATP-binding protein involved in virulence